MQAQLATIEPDLPFGIMERPEGGYVFTALGMDSPIFRTTKAALGWTGRMGRNEDGTRKDGGPEGFVFTPKGSIE